MLGISPLVHRWAVVGTHISQPDIHLSQGKEEPLHSHPQAP